MSENLIVCLTSNSLWGYFVSLWITLSQNKKDTHDPSCFHSIIQTNISQYSASLPGQFFAIWNTDGLHFRKQRNVTESIISCFGVILFYIKHVLKQANPLLDIFIAHWRKKQQLSNTQVLSVCLFVFLFILSLYAFFINYCNIYQRWKYIIPQKIENSLGREMQLKIKSPVAKRFLLPSVTILGSGCHLRLI